jgi:hypothetical protein
VPDAGAPSLRLHFVGLACMRAADAAPARHWRFYRERRALPKSLQARRTEARADKEERCEALPRSAADVDPAAEAERSERSRSNAEDGVARATLSN